LEWVKKSAGSWKVSNLWIDCGKIVSYSGKINLESISFKYGVGIWAWWCMPVIPALEFEASLGYIARLCLKNK
jgi:hypothetical protein